MKKAVLFLCMIFCMVYEPANSQVMYFGRNKVQYTDFRWLVLNTDHFNIYYYPEMKEIAEIGAHYAEESYKFLENKFSHSLNHKIPLIFYGSHLHFQQTNTTPYFIPEGVGGFFEFLKGRVVIPCNGNVFQFKRVIRHELVHVFMHSKIYWAQKNLNRIRFKNPPLWFIEGLAEVWSGEWDSQSEMVIADQVIEGSIIPITSFGLISGSYLMYKEGENFLRFITDKYGDEKLLMIMENFWREDKFEDIFKLVTGKNFTELNEEWIYSLKKRYYPALKDGEIPRMVTDIITRNGFSESPAFYRSGATDKLFFISNTRGYTNIASLDIQDIDEKSKPEIVVKAERSEDFEVIHFLRSKIDVNDEGILAFSSKSGETDVLYLYDVSKKEIIDRFQFEDIVMISSPVWSNSKKKIAFSGQSKGGSSDIYVLNLEIRSLNKITDDFHEDKDPAWSPDDRALVYSSARTEYGDRGAYNLFIQDVETGLLFQITNGRHIDMSPSWSGDGKYLAFTSDRDGHHNIYVMEMYENPDPVTVRSNNGLQSEIPVMVLTAAEDKNRNPGIYFEPGALVKATNFTTGVFDPEWTPEGDIFFTAYENYAYQLRKMNNVIEKVQKLPVLAYGIMERQKNTWQAEKIYSDFQVNTIPYKKKYSLDIAQGQVTSDPIWGSNGGAQFLISDMLGNDNYYLMLYNNSQTKESFFRSFNFSFARYSMKKRANLGYGLFHFSGRRYNYVDLYYSERYYGGFMSVSYPLSVFHRVEVSTNFGRSERDWFFEDQERIALLSSNFITYTRDNSLWGPTGPIDGGRYLISIGNTKDISYNNVNYYTLLLDLRQYFRLTLRSALAFRYMTWVNKGREAQRFFIGGSWDLRGYPRWRIWGQEINFVSAEYRFPFIDNTGVRFPFGGIMFNSIRGALFFDAARVRDELQEGADELGSLGMGIRFNFAGALVLRLDFGKRIENSFTSLSGETYKQFFFGWDF